MRKLKHPNIDPPGGWWFRCTIEGCFCDFRVESDIYPELIKLIKKHLKSNDVAVPDDLEDIVQEQICSRVPADICDGEGIFRNHPTERDVQDEMNRVLRIWHSNGARQTVAADKRNRISYCLSCPLHARRRFGCFKCTQIYKVCTGPRGVSKLEKADDEYLEICDLFMGPCILYVSIESSVIVKAFKDIVEPMKETPAHCWIASLVRGA